MKEIPLTQGGVALVDDDDYERLRRFKWQAKVSVTTYARRTKRIGLRKDNKQVSELMHREILGVTDPEIQVDHKDGNGLNNQKHNLRVAAQTQNNANRRKRDGCSSAYKGVSWEKVTGKWYAYANFGGVMYNLGRYELEADAARAYNAQAKKFFGEFALLNEVPS